ncbi:DUF5017 domain-containing protein [Chitinophaga sp. 30R24]|uniref:DUF5017 domain-containing protein n=1 Tax=Chitinophaga sp. 30R24 TaxID=3248838 RepID=UPI003B919748
MRIFHILPIAVTLFTLSSCSKELSLKTISFDASTAQNNYTPDDTIRFNLSGNADYVTFYSGLPGNRYKYSNRTSASGTPILLFTSARANGTQPNSLKIMVSSDFNGLGTDTATTLANISAANWKDFTDKATLSTGTAVSSGPINLTDMANTNKPVYIAFKYLATSGSKQNKWTITALTINNTLPDNTSYLIANLNAYNTAITNYGATTYSPGWVSYTAVNTYNWAISAGTSLVITGATTPELATDNAEAWVIMGPLDLKKVSPDWGTPIKNVGENISKFPYTYQYATPGAYEVTFLASNANRDKQDSIVKTIQLTVH